MHDVITVENLNKGDILLYHGTSWISKAIRFFDGTDFNHASLYIENNFVVEALSDGIVKNTLTNSIKDSEYVIVKRLKNKPEDMEPVVSRSFQYLGNRYAYEQLLLLALICIFRKININFAIARFIEKLLKTAASILVEFLNADKEALICSELVFRSYDEALESDDDIYTIILEEDHVLSKARISKSKNTNKISSLNPGSIMAYYYYNDMYPSTNNKSTQHTSFEPIHLYNIPSFNKEQIESYSELHNLFEDAVKNYDKKEILDNSPQHTALKNALDMFITADYYVKKHYSINKNINDAIKDIIKSFNKTNSNLVTPGDLYKAKNLELIGKIIK